MKLIDISEKGTLKFKLSDGRFLYNYTSGYVRIDNGGDRLYQINKVVKEIDPYWTGRNGVVMYRYRRVLIPNPADRYRYCVEWVKRNVKQLKK